MDDPDIDSVDPKSDPSAPPAEPPYKPDSISQVPPPLESKRETTNCKPDQTPWWKMILETAAVFIGLYVAGVYHGQLLVMQGQLGEIIKQFPEIQKSANANVKAADQTEKAVHNAAEDFRLDQRAWIGIETLNARADPQSSGNFRLQADIILKNTGKTPAIRMGGEMMLLERSRKEPIPEFDREAAASAKELKERLQGIIKRTPKESRASLAAQLRNVGAQTVIPKGNVLAPEATRAISLIPFVFLVPDPVQDKLNPRVRYILAKFTYFDIFQTKERSTKVCVMWRGGTSQPQICPEGNWMD
jgi:hypothetical protein